MATNSVLLVETVTLQQFDLLVFGKAPHFDELALLQLLLTPKEEDKRWKRVAAEV
ncbi:hypothetical protein H6F88_10505 [Oculatella sp. FACHB-28]|nr:hypothetical protein [Oculatella sp. FACHB-28]